MRYTLFILSALLVFVIPDQSQAQGKDPRVEIRPFVGMRFGGNVNDSGYEPVSGGEELIEDLNVKPGSQFGVMLNVPLALLGAYDPDNSWQLEATLRAPAFDDEDRRSRRYRYPGAEPQFHAGWGSDRALRFGRHLPGRDASVDEWLVDSLSELWLRRHDLQAGWGPGFEEQVLSKLRRRR